MDIYELDSYRLSDAVKFHTELNPALWDGKTMRPEVREALLRIADDFKTFMGIDDLALEDITVSGSNAAFSYTPHSDIDLHLIVDFSKLNPDEVYQELFNAKKYQYNDQHDIKIRGYDVELYVQDSNKPVRSLGEYSIVNDDWIRIPVQRRGNLDEKSTQQKYEKLKGLIELAINSDDLTQVTAVTDTIKKYRQAGLDEHGEFGPENLAYKILRTQGYVERLFKHKASLEDSKLSLVERTKKKKKKSFKYGAFGGMFFPGYHYYDQPNADEQEVAESAEKTMVDVDDRLVPLDKVVRRFAHFAAHYLKLPKLPRIVLRGPEFSKHIHSFGHYVDDKKLIEIETKDRHIMDILRTLAHELTHYRQHLQNKNMPDTAGVTGSKYENEAHAEAGVVMRHFQNKYPDFLNAKTVPGEEDVDEGVGKALGTAALAGAMALGGGGAKAQSPVGTAYDLGRIVYNAPRTFTKAGAEEELKGIARDMARGSSEIRVGGKRIWGGPQPQGERVAANGQGDTPEAAYQDALTRAYADANRRYGPIASISDWRPVENEKELERVGGQYRASVVIQGPASVRENASGYIPTKKQARDPRFKTALTVDIKPGQLGKEANKLGLQTDSQGRPDLLMKNLQNALREFKESGEFIIESERLDEVKMSPSALEAWAKSPEAEGIRAGFEAEMIFRDTKRDDDDEDQEPDYDYDERPGSIEDVIDFFSNDDWGFGLSPRGARKLRSTLSDEYQEWVADQVSENWDNEAEDQVRDYMETNVWGDDSTREELIRNKVEDMFPDDDADAIMAAGDAAPRFTKVSDQQEYVKEHELYQKYLDASDEAHEDFEQEATNEFESQGRYYDEAREYYTEMMMDSGDYDESDFLRAQYGYMSEIGNSHNLDWPYWTGGSQGGGERDWSDIADSLRNVVDMEVKVGSGYHSTTRKEGRWIIEPDSSLDPDDSDDMGLEIVSPPMPLPQALEKLEQVLEWGNSEANAYTNQSTGLHMGISIPYVGGNVDYVKLVLFMGDQYVLDKFERAGNHYCDSAMKKLKQNVQGARNRGELEEAVSVKFNANTALELIKNNLIELAQRYVQGGVGNSKYTSAHIKDGYIEFRSPGGDYLSMVDRNGMEDDVKNTMLRFARAMYIAGRPDLERREYAKKLTKLLSHGSNNNDALKLFADYVAGTISPEQLKKQWADAVLQKELPHRGKEEYEVYDMNKKNNPDGVIDILYARDYDDAYDQYRAKHSNNSNADIRRKKPWWDVVDSEGKVVGYIRSDSDYDAASKAELEYPDWNIDTWDIVAHPENAAPEKKLSRRAQVAQRIKEPKVSPAVAADNARDSAQLRARIGEPQPIGTRYNVAWGIWDPASNGFVNRRGLIGAGVPLIGGTTPTDALQSARNHGLGHRIDSGELEVREVPATNNANSLSQTDIENRLGWGSQEADANYEVVDRRTMTPVFKFIANTPDEAARKYTQVMDVMMLPHDTENYGWRAIGQAIPGSTVDLQRQRAAQSSEVFTGSWQVRDSDTNDVLYTFSGVGNSQADANRVAAHWLQQNAPNSDMTEITVVPVMR